ncbi:TetR/AcrR family transcriptional regulator [Salipaludibacillus aurantiacus]|uniref:TetR/AcrR family transcriptional regulator, fatty acid metabolism regulator protein n=1 Tax=Salipaludibacillus aurantiacus TaxID=1601833 RepID=A0A1H9T0X3_9BACI|nr:TetR/AcrR family transcriptional regulator [Salipaludibacillus aurantiacus]SER90788.1 TetR/AcrR family transcriptional regulator, fatty acid metabolism regulator protein [Salipaludibacillus aurantiacus]
MGKKRGQKYEQIIDAAVKVIAENGYHHSQVSKIAKEAGVADGTIYLYFKNKEDILISLFEEKMGSFVDAISEKLNEESSVEKKLLILIEMHFMQLEMDHDLAIVTQLELRQSNISIRNKVNEVLKGYLGLVDSVLKEGVEKGIFEENLDLRIARQLIFGAIDEVVTNWVMKDHRYDLAPLAETVHRMLLKGLSKN